MNLGNRLLNLRKAKGLSQEEVAEKLDVSRQTISKWETDQSTPDFDKIIPLCKLYEISSDELLTGNISSKKEKIINNGDINLYDKKINEENKIKRAKGIALGVLLYFVAVVFLIISVSVLLMNPIIATSIFLLICGIATFIIIYVSIVYSKQKNKEEKEDTNLRKQIENIVAIFVTIIYLAISFATMAWHITWIIWVVFALFSEILKLIFILKGDSYEE